SLKAIFFACVTIVSAISFAVLLFNQPEFVVWMLPVAAITALIFGVVASFAPSTVHITGTVYCVLQGAVVGVVSAFVEVNYQGVVLSALLSTLGVFMVMMLLYSTGVIKVGQKFRSFMLTALISIVLLSLVLGLVSMFNQGLREQLWGNGPLALGISVLMILLASLFILVDLSRIDEIVKSGLDSKYEWIASFGLIVTLIWLYIEMLRFFMILSSRRN
ncbi:MAG: Bax inhibitor-1/YccA family protein, partial [Clostridiales bacterium]|nr:Bax inhibitor-1/YccA family protein [Clostridiales bacterium]